MHSSTKKQCIMKNTEKRYRSFLADSSKKFLKVGLLVSLVLVIVAFKAPIYGSSDRSIYDPGYEDQEIDTLIFVTLPVQPKKTPPKLKETKKQPKVFKIDPVQFTPVDLDPIDVDEPDPVDPVDITIEVVDEPDFGLGGNIPEQFPVYAGGEAGLMSYLVTAKYCKDAIRMDEEGTVYVSFTVNKKGKVTDIELERGVYPCLDQEAIRMVEEMEDWTPGKHGLSNVNVRMVLPFKFILNN